MVNVLKNSCFSSNEFYLQTPGSPTFTMFNVSPVGQLVKFCNLKIYITSKCFVELLCIRFLSVLNETLYKLCVVRQTIIVYQKCNTWKINLKLIYCFFNKQTKFSKFLFSWYTGQTFTIKNLIGWDLFIGSTNHTVWTKRFLESMSVSPILRFIDTIFLF